MHKRLLVPVDRSAAATAGLQEAIRLAGSSKAVIRLVHVVDRLSLLQGLQPPQIIAEMLVVMERAGRDILESARSQAAKSGVAAEVAMRKPARGRVADSIVREGKRGKADLIVMGTHQAQDPWRIVLGGTASGVLRQSVCPVFLVPPRSPRRRPINRILVPIDGSAAAKAGLREALRLAKGNSRSAIRLLHVLGQMPILQGMPLFLTETVLANARQAGKGLLRDARVLAGKTHRRVTAAFREEQGPGLAPAVVDEARRWKADVIVMGTHGRRGVSRLVLGSGAEAVVGASTLPVLLVRA